MAEPFKKLNDGKTVYIPVGTGEALAAIHEETIIAILLAIYESVSAAITHTNATQTALIAAADFPAFQAAMATALIPAAVKTIAVEKGLRS